MIKRSIWMFAALVTVLSLAGVGWLYPVWRVSSAVEQGKSVTQAPVAADVFIPLPQAMALDGRKVKLGERLFRDKRLSSDGTVSCSSCHDLGIGGVDRLPRSRGIGGREGAINAPTVFNSGFNFRQFWNGRAATLEDQIDGPLQNSVEMGNTWPQALATIAADTQYRDEFKAIYPDGIQSNNVKDAIATFERSLITPNSRFDRFLRGDQSAMSPGEQAGYALFRRIGCTSCHQGINIGGNMYQRLGIMEDYFVVRGNLTEADLGRFLITQRDEDRYFFKVPSLRNVAVTPPYLHDSSAETLEDAVQVMARFQLGRKLETRDVNSIVVFLRTLTGEYSGKPLQ